MTQSLPTSAMKQIAVEAAYLSVLLLSSCIMMAILWWAPSWVGLDVPALPTNDIEVNIRTDQEVDLVPTQTLVVKTTRSEEFQRFALAFLAGIIGGTAFAMKWLHHSVSLGPYDPTTAKNGWVPNRFLWRIYVPILGGIISWAFYAILQSGLLGVEFNDTTNPQAFAVGLGFIVGYFADRAAAKLRDVAYVLFGETKRDEFDDS